MSEHAVVVVLAGLAMAVGIAGTVVPVLPGLPVAWLAALGYGLFEGFGVVGIVAMVVITALAVGGTAAGVSIPKRRAAAAGAAASSLWLGAALGVAGFFLVPIVGLPLGGVLGVYLGEHLRTSDARVAWRTTRATIAGFGLAAAVQLGAGLAMALTWAVWVVVG